MKKSFMRRTLQISVLLVIVLSAAYLFREYRALNGAPVPVASTPPVVRPGPVPGVPDMPSPATTPMPTIVPTSNALPAGARAGTPEGELAFFREPRYAKMMKLYTENFEAYAKLGYLPIDPTVRVEDVAGALRPAIGQLIGVDNAAESLAGQYGENVIRSLERHLGLVLLRLSGLDAERYLEAAARSGHEHLYVPDSIAQYRLVFTTLLSDVPVVVDDKDQIGLRRIFDRLSTLQLQGPSATNNRITGWNNDPQKLRLQLIETQGNDLDGGILRIRDRDDASARHYYSGGVLLGSMIFTTPPPNDVSNKLLSMFNVVVRTSDDFYTVLISSYYDPSSGVWQLREVVRCVSPRPSMANPLVF